jgi:DNA-binding transcriptional regulator YbjK
VVSQERLDPGASTSVEVILYTCRENREGAAMTTDRRTLIADAVIQTLADAGSRGLTHRAVDDAAGLPRGSTSYYLPTRDSLLEAGVHRLAELDAASVPPLEGDALAVVLSRVLEQQLSVDRPRLIARYELSLEAVRRPRLREVLAAGTRQVREAVCARLIEDGIAEPDGIADDLLAMLEGLLFTQVTSAEGSVRSREELQRAIERMLAGTGRQ